ncbi:Ribosomal protein S4 [Forsythia ovata]|uniref:Ribosomal protein S4 n=1 Tax=Forsythia ovata TaxID=205694 RepID=A0ABD1RZG0_9LAMI
MPGPFAYTHYSAHPFNPERIDIALAIKSRSFLLNRLADHLQDDKGCIIKPCDLFNRYIQSQTTRKLSLFHGDLPITEMHRRTKRSYIPFLLNPETRSDVISVRLHFRETIPQARQSISHRRVCVNNRMVNITHFKVSHGDIIAFQEDDARTRGEEIRRSFYIKISVEKIIGKFLDRPVRMWRRTKTEWFRKLKTKKGCRLLLKPSFCNSCVLLCKKKTQSCLDPKKYA